MNRARTSVCLISSALLVAAALAQDDLPDWPERELRFERVDDAIVVTGISEKPGLVRPRYAASLLIAKVGSLDKAQVGSPVDDWLLQAPSAEQLSEEQRNLVRGADVVRSTRVRGKPVQYSDPELGIQIYAVTEEDARVMARAVIEWVERSHRRSFEQKRDMLIDWIAVLAERHHELEEFLRKHPDPAERLRGVKKTVWYESIEEAREDMRVLEKAMRGVDVDISGIAAKTTSIRKYLDDADVARQPGVENMLSQLLIQQDIEMAGAVARKAALDSHLQRARAYVRAVEACEKHQKMTRLISGTERSIELKKNELRNPGERMRPVDVLGPVTIQPVECAHE